MKRDIFENKASPFTVPEGYFDTLQGRIMTRISAEERQSRIIRMPLYRKMIAAAACVLFIFSASTLYFTYTGKPSVMSELIDEDFYQWLYASDRLTQMAESFDVAMPEHFSSNETGFSEEEEAIIQFLERDNFTFAAILYSIDNDLLSFQ